MLNTLNKVSTRTVEAALLDGMTALRSGLGELIPAQLRGRWTRDPKQLEIAIDDRSGAPFIQSNGHSKPMDVAALRTLSRRWGPLLSATISVPQHKCFMRELQLPRAARARFADILRVDLERTLPFQADEVLSDWQIVADGEARETVTVAHVILKRKVVAQVLQDLAAAGIPLKGIMVTAADGHPLPVNLLDRSLRRRARSTIWMRNIVIAQAIAAAALAVVWFGVTVAGLGTALAVTEQDLQAATKEAQAVRRRMAELDAHGILMRHPHMRKIERKSALAIWEEVTEILPAATWLTDLRIEDGQVQIDGQSSNASELIALLSRSSQFVNVAFASPVTRDPQRDVERFQIRFQASRTTMAPAQPKDARLK